MLKNAIEEFSSDSARGRGALYLSMPFPHFTSFPKASYVALLEAQQGICKCVHQSLVHLCLNGVCGNKDVDMKCSFGATRRIPDSLAGGSPQQPRVKMKCGC